MILPIASTSLLSRSLKCARCNKTIKGEYIIFEGKNYHPACFEIIVPKCSVCGESLAGDQYVVTDKGKYHQRCYEQHIALRCDVCGLPLEGTYKEDHWGTKYHLEHEHELDRCAYCARFICQSVTGGGYDYDDGRHVCAICYKSAVTEKWQVYAAVERVRSLLAKHSISVDMAEIPVSLVSPQQLSALSGVDSDDEMGFCKLLNTVYAGETIARSHSVFILIGLPELVFEGVLAHEMMHAWLNLNCRKLPPPRHTEGSANYASYLTYSQYDNDFARYLIQSLEKSPDPLYGEGYRQIKKYVDRHGLPSLLITLKLTGDIEN